MEVKVTKLTDLGLLHRCAEYTTGHECKMTLAQAYASGHSIIRSQLFLVECINIPLFVASQLVRHNVGVQFFQRSKRTDRGGEDFDKACQDIVDGIWKAYEQHNGPMMARHATKLINLPERFDRKAPTDLCFIANAEALINMAHKRLCNKASVETRRVMQEIKDQVGLCDPYLTYHLVPMCVYRNGFCSEPHSCGFNISTDGWKAILRYKTNQHTELNRKE